MVGSVRDSTKAEDQQRVAHCADSDGGAGPGRHSGGVWSAQVARAGVRRDEALYQLGSRLGGAVAGMAVSGRLRCRHRQDRIRQLRRTLGRATASRPVPPRVRGREGSD